jgi:glyoxylase-like metal-dependent hydrolase (beta-lactamase superfamily II)
MHRYLFTMFVILVCPLVTLPQSPPVTRPLPQFPSDPSRKHDRDFSPSGQYRDLTRHLSVYRDTCNVYVLHEGRRALLVGFGSGDVLGELSRRGIDTVEQVLLTHHHRDQAQGLCDLKERAFQLAVPAQEAQYFENVEQFWNDLRLYINYNCRSHWNTIRRSVRVDRKLDPGDVVTWRGYELRTIETAGSTDHSVSFATRVDGRNVAFTGNLISGAGKVPNWFDLHWDYYGFTQGIDASEKGFAALEKEGLDWLLPAQGEPIADPGAAMAANRRTYGVLREMLVPNELHREHQEVRQILPHLVFVGANCYAVISESGSAFLYDYGYVDRSRIDELKSRFGVKTIEAVSFSHYHDDHLIRTHELLQENTRVWVFENMLEVLEHPARYRLPCLVPFPIPADRVLKDGGKVRWHEYTMEFFHQPGQTEFHQGLLVAIDGKKVLFTGDNTWNKEFPGKVRNGPLVPQNEYFLDGGFIRCAQTMLDRMPDLVCPAHTEEYSPTREDLLGFRGWAQRLRDVMTSLIDQPDPNFGMDYRWCHIYPYRSIVEPGQTLAAVEVRVRNHLFKPARVRVRLRLPEGIRCAVPDMTVTIPAKSGVAIPYELQCSGDGRRSVITADITINGRRIGEYAEALIDRDR